MLHEKNKPKFGVRDQSWSCKIPTKKKKKEKKGLIKGKYTGHKLTTIFCFKRKIMSIFEILKYSKSLRFK